MRALLRALLGVLGLTLAASILLSAPAGAAPVQPPEPAQRAGGTSGVWLTSHEWQISGYVAKARNKAVSANGKTMDYRKMKTIFGSHTNWRRPMAAAFRQAGGKVQHISKAENKKVEKTRKKMYGKRSPLRLGAATLDSAAKASCKGKSGKVVVNSKETHKNYNSCQTTDLKYYWGGCIGAMTFLGRFTEKKPKVDIPRYFIASFCAFELAAIQRASEKSDIGAIYLRTYKQEAYQPYTGGKQYFIEYSLEPQ